MHRICRLFLERLGPKIKAGERLFLPFMLYMPKLFETFVPNGYRRTFHLT